MKYREEFMEALRLSEIFIPPIVRGLYQIIVEALTVSLAEFSEGKNAEEESEERD